VFNFFAAPPDPGVFADGVKTITAANGDELWVGYGGSFLFTPEEGQEGVGTSDLTYGPMTFVGGTGRFLHATGSLIGTAVDAFGSAGNTSHFDGWIAYAASDVATK
jgi:hypothetical protein